MKVMLQGLEEQFISKLFAQPSLDWAVLETSMNNTQSRVLEFEATCNMLMVIIMVNRMIKLKKDDLEKRSRHDNIHTDFLENGEGPRLLFLSQNV